MIKNAEMKPNRFLFWNQYRKMIANIQETLALGGEIHICTYTQATRYSAKHAGMFMATRTGAWVQRGKSWDCIIGCKIIHRRPVAA